MRLAALIASISLVALACDGGPLGGGDADISGVWDYQAEYAENDCSATAEIEFIQSEAGVSGRVTSMDIDCGRGDTEVEANMSSASVDGSEVAFELIDFFHTGTVDGGRISGTAEGSFEFQSGLNLVTLVEGPANWTATRR